MDLYESSVGHAKSATAHINRESTRHNDPETCFHTLAIDIWGPMNTPALGKVSYVLLGAVCF